MHGDSICCERLLLMMRPAELNRMLQGTQLVYKDHLTVTCM